MALAVIYYSPVQWLYWYDRPTDYQDEPETEFFAQVPTVWDLSIVVDGQIGEFIVSARKKDNDWYMERLRMMRLELFTFNGDFLAAGSYVATIYQNGFKCDNPNQSQHQSTKGKPRLYLPI